MKWIVIVLCWLLPFFTSAQEKGTIKFSIAKNWTDLLAEAQKAGKPIFVDAFTTWCGPCRQMDREVFKEKIVADFVNRNFIAIRIQDDQTKNDNEFIKNWQKETERWRPFITGYPCFLFFNSRGELLSRELGFHKAPEFLKLLQKAADPDQSYASRLRHFWEGKINKDQMLSLAFFASSIRDTIAAKVATEYKHLYLDPLPVDSLLIPKTSRIFEDFYRVFNSRDQIVQYMSKHPLVADSLYQRKDNFSQKIVDYLISRDYIYSQILPNDIPIKSVPNWSKLHSQIAHDFDTNTADRLVLNSKITWAYRHKNFEEAVRFEFEKIDKYGMDTTLAGRGFINNKIYSMVFQNVDDTALLKKAASLMKYVNELENHQNATYIDTYASILYKAGDKQKALNAENAALELAKKQKKEQDVQFYTHMIERMKRGEQIWEEDRK